MLIKAALHNSLKMFLIYKDQLKSSLADQDILMECGQMRFIFQQDVPCTPHPSSIGIAALGSHWSKASSTADMT